MPPEPTSPPRGARVGEHVDGRYKVLSFIGAGGMGEVYEAEHLQVGKRVALKFLLRVISDDADQLERFEREARVASLVESPHLVDVFDAGTHADGTRYLVMELLRGRTLAAELSEVGTMSGQRACEIVRQVATGLGAAHSAGITHRDLKPDNVFLVAGPSGAEQVKILDFGASKFRRADVGLEITRTGTAIGTPLYMSPEQCDGSREVDGRSDVWAIGVLLYRMLVGQHPFSGETYARLVINIATAKAPSLASRRPDLPPKLDAIVSRCLEKAPMDRYATMRDLVDALDGVVAAQPGNVRASAPRMPIAVIPSEPTTEKEDTPTSETRPVGRRAIGSAPAVTPPPPAGFLRDETLPFDQVVITEVDGRRTLSAHAFFDLPLSERIRHVIARSVTFLSRGVEVDRQAALAKLRERRAAGFSSA